MIRSYYTVYLYGLHAPQNKNNYFPTENCIFLTEAGCVYCAVRTESLNVTQIRSSNHTPSRYRKKKRTYVKKASIIRAMYYG